MGVEINVVLPRCETQDGPLPCRAFIIFATLVGIAWVLFVPVVDVEPQPGRGAGREGGMVTTAHLGHLQHGNPAGDPSTAPRCGAKTRSGKKCCAPAMRNPK